VRVAAASSQPVSVDYATADGTASSSSDYAAAGGTLTFAPGVKSKKVTISVNGDALYERNESFFVNLSNSVNATIADNQGRGTILNDAPQPSLSVADASTSEGSSGSKSLKFTITLSAPCGLNTRVSYATADGSATANSDYLPRSGSLFLSAGTLSEQISI